MKYSDNYSEMLTLDDSTQLEFRAIRPTDKAALVESFGHLSAASRRRRFFTPKMQLSDDELRYFTECDGINHYAIVAVYTDGSTMLPFGVGVARYVCIKDQPEAAELAIVVVDSWHRRGIGKRLLKRIVAAAAEHEVRQILAIAQDDNTELLGLLREHTQELNISHADGVAQICFDLSPTEGPGMLSGMLAALQLVASGAIMIPRRLGQLTLEQFMSHDQSSTLDSGPTERDEH